MSGRASAPEPSADAVAMVGWAQLLYDVVERRLRPDGATDLLAPSWDTAFDDAFATVMREMLADRLGQLSPEQFVATYRSVAGDAALLAELDALVAERARIAHRDRALLRRASEARIAGRLRLRDLDADETLDIGLFDPTRPRLASWGCRDDVAQRPLHRVVRVRLTTPTTGEARVVTDTWCGAVWAERWRTPPLPSMTSVVLGTALPGVAEPLPELTLHAPISLTLDAGRVLTPPQIVGYVRTLDGRLILDPPESTSCSPSEPSGGPVSGTVGEAGGPSTPHRGATRSRTA